LRHNVTPVRKAWGVDTDKDNDPTPIEQRDAPGGEVAQRSWTSVLANDANQLAVSGALMAMGYGAKLAVDKIRKPPPPPPPPSGSASSGGA
jgi:hypothetical protein